MKRIVLSIIIILTTIIATGTGQAKLMVIANPEVSTQEMSMARLKQIYLNRSKKWHDGNRIHLTILENQPVTLIFIEQYLGKSCAQFNRYWKQQLFSGKGVPPEHFSSLKALLLYIKTTKGAIGFIDCETPPPGVTVIKIVD